MSEVVMPRLSDTMEEGTILKWLIADGREVKRGEELVEIETDKANMTYESDLDGTLEIVAAAGETLPVGAVIARVGEPHVAATEGAPAREAPQATHEAEPEAPPERASAQTPEAPGNATARADDDGGGRVKSSPLARRIAEERGIDLHGIAGSGPGGRIVKADVERTTALPPEAGTAAGAPSEPGRPDGAPERRATPARAAGPADVARAKGETTEIELTKSQQAVARRMAESKATIPHFALQADVDMDACARLRAELKRIAEGHREPEGEGAPVPTYNDMVVKACALALREHPRANSSYRDGRLLVHGRVNVGVAVATEPDGIAGGTLVVPTVFDADTKSLGEIARETRALAAKVRDGTITPPELGGGTFTVSNLGMFGVDAFTAIVNPPQAAILAVGAVRAKAVVGDDGELTARQTLAVTLACDHRALYGADAARFLARIKEALERPASLTL